MWIDGRNKAVVKDAEEQEKDLEASKSKEPVEVQVEEQVWLKIWISFSANAYFSIPISYR